MNLEKLLQYQEEDKKLRKIEEEVKSSEAYKKYASAHRFMNGAKEKFESIDKRTGELKSLLEELNRREGEITNAIAEYNELDEMIDEGGDIGYYEKTVRALADRLRSLKGELSKLTSEIEAMRNEYNKFLKQTIAMQKQRAEYKVKYDEIFKSRAEEVDKIKQNLDELAKNVPAEILEKYAAKCKEKIFPVFVPLKNERCVCGMNFPLAQTSTLSGGNVIECEHCRRFVYNK